VDRGNGGFERGDHNAMRARRVVNPTRKLQRRGHRHHFQIGPPQSYWYLHLQIDFQVR
jgi:hypothetical protein